MQVGSRLDENLEVGLPHSRSLSGDRNEDDTLSFPESSTFKDYFSPQDGVVAPLPAAQTTKAFTLR